MLSLPQDDQKKTNYTEGSIEKLREEKSNLLKQAERLQQDYNSVSDRYESTVTIIGMDQLPIWGCPTRVSG